MGIVPMRYGEEQRIHDKIDYHQKQAAKIEANIEEQIKARDKHLERVAILHSHLKKNK